MPPLLHYPIDLSYSGMTTALTFAQNTYNFAVPCHRLLLSVCVLTKVPATRLVSSQLARRDMRKEYQYIVKEKQHFSANTGWLSYNFYFLNVISFPRLALECLYFVKKLDTIAKYIHLSIWINLANKAIESALQ